jgi:hypothetical protein
MKYEHTEQLGTEAVLQIATFQTSYPYPKVEFGHVTTYYNPSHSQNELKSKTELGYNLT